MPASGRCADITPTMSSTKAGSECHADGIVVGIPQVEVDLSGGQSIDHADAVQWCDPDGGPGGTRHEPFVEYNKQRHLAVENAISGGGFTTVSLRPGAFARNAIRFWARQIRHPTWWGSNRTRRGLASWWVIMLIGVLASWGTGRGG